MLVKKLSKFKGIAVDFWAFEGDEWTRFEAIALATALEDAFDEAGLDTRGYWGSNCNAYAPLTGVEVLSSAGTTQREAAAWKAIVALFSKEGIEQTFFVREFPTCQMISGLRLPNPKKLVRPWTNIRIMVGNKPPVMLNRPGALEVNRPVTAPKR